MHKNSEKWIEHAVYTGQRPKKKEKDKDYVLVTDLDISKVTERVLKLVGLLGIPNDHIPGIKELLNTWVKSTAYDQKQATIYQMMSQEGIEQRKNKKVQAHWRYYNNYIDLVLALYGDYCSKDKLVKETALAGKILLNSKIISHIKSIAKKITQLAEKSLPNTVKKDKILSAGAYITLHKDVANWITWEEKNQTMEPGKIVACLHDITKPFLKPLNWTEATMDQKGLKITKQKMRINVSTPEEEFGWSSRARWQDVPIWAAPSYTTHQMLTVAKAAGATKEEIQAYAYCIFAFWNKEYPHTATPIHRMYGVMTAAREFGVKCDACDPGKMYLQAENFIGKN